MAQLQVCVKPPASAVNRTLPAFAAECCYVVLLLLSMPAAHMWCQHWLAAVGQYLVPTGNSEANPPATTAAVNQRDRQTDGRITTKRWSLTVRYITEVNSQHRPKPVACPHTSFIHHQTPKRRTVAPFTPPL